MVEMELDRLPHVLCDARRTIRSSAFLCPCPTPRQTLIETLGTLGLELKGDDQEGLKAAKERIAALTPEDTLTPEIAEDVSMLWADEGMQASQIKRALSQAMQL